MTTEPAQELTELAPPSDVNPRREPVLDFPDRGFGSLTADDYASLGFMAGLEVHQQLATRTKLFCRCPAGKYVDDYDAEVLRHMRPTLSELGEYDGTALMEFKTRKEIVYRLNRATVCTYEIDDTPPFAIDEEAVRTALAVCRMFNLDLVSEIHVMRKQYLDGSIPAGFQRTAMMGIGGSIPFRVPELGIDRELRIRQLSLEEDACREASDLGHRITFITDRLGTPLTEVVTEPELLTPLELQAGARLIARTTQALGRVRRGPGAARQDVNVSVAGGRRVEIKGVDHHRGLPRLVHVEAYRQLNLLRIRAELTRRELSPGDLAVPDKGMVWDVSPLAVDVTSLLRKSDYLPLRETLESRGMAVAVRLPGFRGVLTHRTQPGVTFASELAERVRVIACLTARPFMIHSEIEGYGLATNEWRHVRNALHATRHDSMVVLWGPERDVDTGLREVLARAREAFVGVPAETRQALADGNTGFERVLPGAERMYPDTDTPPLAIPDDWVQDAEASLPERPWKRQDRYVTAGLEESAAGRVSVASWAPLFDATLPLPDDVARRVAFGLEKRIPPALRRGRPLPAPQALRALTTALVDGTLRHEAFEACLDLVLEGAVPEAALATFRPTGKEEAELSRRLEAVSGDTGGRMFVSRAGWLRWALGQTLAPMLGRVDPERVHREVAALPSGPREVRDHE